jgi:hypothetical protein
MPLFKDKQLPHPGNPKGEPNFGEREFETGIDEQYKQAGASGTKSLVDDRSKRNDRSEDYYSTLVNERMSLMNEKARNQENERATRAQNIEAAANLARLAAGEHYRHGYDKLQNLEPAEAEAISQVLSGPQIEAIQSMVIKILGDAVKKAS